MLCRPFLAASSRRPISLSLRKSLARSWPSVVGAGEAFWALLWTFRLVGGPFFIIITPDSIWGQHSILWTENTLCLMWHRVSKLRSAVQKRASVTEAHEESIDRRERWS